MICAITFGPPSTFWSNMAVRVSRNHLGTILYHGTAWRNMSHPLFFSCLLDRRNASSSVAKPVEAAARTSSQSAPASQKSSTLKTARKKATPVAIPPTQTTSKSVSAADSSNNGRTKKYQDMTEEEREKEIQRLLQISELMPTVDPFGQEIVDTLGGLCSAFCGLLFSQIRRTNSLFIQGRRHDSLSRRLLTLKEKL